MKNYIFEIYVLSYTIILILFDTDIIGANILGRLKENNQLTYLIVTTIPVIIMAILYFLQKKRWISIKYYILY